MWSKRPTAQRDNVDEGDDDADDVQQQQRQEQEQAADGHVTTDDTVLLFPPVPPPPSKPSPPMGKKYQTFPASSPPQTSDNGNGSQAPPGTPHPAGNAVPDKRGRGHTRFVYVLACFGAVGGLLFGYDTGIISGSMLLIQPFFELSTFWEELIVSGTIGAAAVSSLVGGLALVDRVGRKRVIMAASVIFTVGAVVMAAAPNKETLLLGRIVVGVGIGFASVAVPVYIAESSPPDIRGMLVTFVQLFITVGIILSSIVAGVFSHEKSTGWRYMLGLAAVPGVVQFCGFFFLPESPRWLVSKGRDAEARRVLRRTRGHDDVDEEIQQIKDAEVNKQTGFALGQILRTPHVRRALIVGCGLQFFQQMCGINTVIYYSGTILKEAGFHVSQAIWLVTVPFSINFLATFIGICTVERFGRKMLLIFSFLGVTVALVVLSAGFLVTALTSPPVNSTLPVLYPNGSKVTDQCQGFSLCEDCINVEHCGYCYDANQPEFATCALAQKGEEDSSATYGLCSSRGGNSSATIVIREGEKAEWTFGFCPTAYGWMAVLGLALFVLSFAPGLGPMPWTINSEIYPMWARGTGMALATMTNWVCNLLVSFTFLTLFHVITKYGTFFLFAGISVLGIVFTLLMVPETRHKTLEEMEQVFMSPQQQLQEKQQQQQRRQQQQQQQEQQQQEQQQEVVERGFGHSAAKRPSRKSFGDGGGGDRHDTEF